MHNSSHHIAVSIWNTERLLVCQSCRNPPVTLARAADMSLCRRLRFPPSVRGVFGRMSRLPFKFWSQQKLGFLPVSFLLLSLGFSQTAARKKKKQTVWFCGSDCWDFLFQSSISVKKTQNMDALVMYFRLCLLFRY